MKIQYLEEEKKTKLKKNARKGGKK